MKKLIILTIMIVSISACVLNLDPQVDKNNALYDTSVQPLSGQPNFPKIGKYWVVDPENACHFEEKTVQMADQTFEALRQDHIAEVAVVCQSGVKNLGPVNDEKIWSMRWGRFARLGDKNDRRAIVWLIRPDVRPEDSRVTIEASTWFVWYTALDYHPGLEEAAMYANVSDFDGALESIARTTDETLRKRWKEKQDQVEK